MSKRRLRPDEARAWARVARSVKTLAPDREAFVAAMGDVEDAASNPGLTPPKAPAPPKRSTPPPLSSVRRVGDHPYPPKIHTPENRGGERRVRRGNLSISARYDLHGHTQASAQTALPGFLSYQRQQGARCVLIITGKGKQGEGVLKRNFLNWLETAQARALVSGYSQAHRKHGGAGAYYVFLRRL